MHFAEIIYVTFTRFFYKVVKPIKYHARAYSVEFSASFFGRHGENAVLNDFIRNGLPLKRLSMIYMHPTENLNLDPVSILRVRLRRMIVPERLCWVQNASEHTDAPFLYV